MFNNGYTQFIRQVQHCGDVIRAPRQHGGQRRNRYLGRQAEGATTPELITRKGFPG